MGLSLLALFTACPHAPPEGSETRSEDTGSPVDADGDGCPLPADCDDGDPTVYPGAVDPCDGIDGDGLLDVALIQQPGAEWASGAMLAGCSGCAQPDISADILVGDEAFRVYGASPDPEVGDLDGDGVTELSLEVIDYTGTTDEGTCVVWPDGAQTGAGEATVLGAATRACGVASPVQGLSSSADVDGDDVHDVVWGYTDYDSEPHHCLIPSTRLALGARVEMLEVSWCIDGLHFVSQDLSGDGYPDFVGSDGNQPDDAPSCGNTPVMLGFDIPWENPSKW